MSMRLILHIGSTTPPVDGFLEGEGLPRLDFVGLLGLLSVLEVALAGAQTGPGPD